jgi:hypothetical protein
VPTAPEIVLIMGGRAATETVLNYKNFFQGPYQQTIEALLSSKGSVIQKRTPSVLGTSSVAAAGRIRKGNSAGWIRPGVRYGAVSRRRTPQTAVPGGAMTGPQIMY